MEALGWRGGGARWIEATGSERGRKREGRKEKEERELGGEREREREGGEIDKGSVGMRMGQKEHTEGWL